jgi:hypothetical protein
VRTRPTTGTAPSCHRPNCPFDLGFAPFVRTSSGGASGTIQIHAEIPKPFSVGRRAFLLRLLSLEMPEDHVDHIVLGDARDHLHL